MYEYQARQGCTALVDGLGPDGNGDVLNPQNNLTCDRDGDGILDGNRLFSRPPLVARLRLTMPGADEWNELWVIANHWKSKVEDTYWVQYTLPRRLEQAQFVAALVQEIIQTDAEASLIVTGDLNDHPDSLPLLEMSAQGLEDLLQRVPHAQQYTYIYEGVSQSLDYILSRTRPPLYPLQIQAVHINADYPVSLEQEPGVFYRSSDHDPLWVEIVAFPPQIYLPMISR